MIVANNPESNFLYQNNGDGTFVRITSGALVNDGGLTRCLSWADYDNDGDLDIFVCNDFGDNNFLYENRRNGAFIRVTEGAIVTDGGTSRSSSWGDYDNDGDLDLLVTNGGTGRLEVNFLYQNLGDGTFNRVITGALANDVLEQPILGGWGDYDNDGDLDVVLISGFGLVLYDNNGDRSFNRVMTGVIVEDRDAATSPIWGDHDNDGDLDLFVTNSNNRASLYCNDGNGNNWINIMCVGSLSNRSAIGAKVRVSAVINDRQVQQLREISGQNGHSLNAEFGLGDATVIDLIRVEWPSGQVQLLTDVAVNQFLTITEILPPQIEYSSIPVPVEAANEISVEVSVTATDLAGTRLLFRVGGNRDFTSVPMSDLGNGSFRGIIPASAVTSRGVDYRFEATDIAGNTGRLPREGNFSISVNVPAGISREEEEPFGSDQTAYHLFSVPLDLQDRNPAAILEDDMGEYDDARWRFLEYVPEEQRYREFPGIERLQPGKGYWFLVTEPARVIDTPGGTSFTTAEPRTVLARSGWNLIGNPFNFAIPVSNVRLGVSPVELRTYNGSWNNPISDPVTEIRPFEGYAVMIDDFAAELFIDPNVPVTGLAKSAHPSTPLRMKQNSLHGEPFDYAVM